MTTVRDGGARRHPAAPRSTSNPQTALVLVCLHALAALAALRLTNSLPTQQQAHR